MKHLLLISEDSVNFNSIENLLKGTFAIDKENEGTWRLSLKTPVDSFNTKELIVLDCLKRGFTYKEMAQELNISIDGVRFYVKKIYNKLGVKNSRQAIQAFEAMEN